MKVYSGSAWLDAYVPSSDFVSQIDGDIGAAELPVGTEAQRPTAATGLMRFNTDSGSFEGYNGTAWGSIGGGATDDAFYENSQTLSANVTIASGRNAMTTGPLTVGSGYSVTIEAGCRVVVI